MRIQLVAMNAEDPWSQQPPVCPVYTKSLLVQTNHALYSDTQRKNDLPTVDLYTDTAGSMRAHVLVC